MASTARSAATWSAETFEQATGEHGRPERVMHDRGSAFLYVEAGFDEGDGDDDRRVDPTSCGDDGEAMSQ